MRSGKAYIEGLRDGRTILLDGERVKDVTTHPAFRAAIERIASCYDAARATPERTSYVDPATGKRFGSMWLVPRSADDLGTRRAAHRFWAEASYGHMGRTPDHVASVLTAFAGSADLFNRGGARYGENVVRFYEKARDEDLYAVYAIVPPQVDRSKPAHQQPEPFLYAGVVKERDDGVVIRGAQMIATSAVMADYIFVSYITPLQRGDEDYAVSFVVPVGADGVRLYPRRPYSTTATGVYDYPLSSRFDEVDSMVVFDDVFVPWEHVFIYRDVDLVNAQFHETPSHTLANFQSLARFCVKLEFAAGLAAKLAKLHGLGSLPPVQAQLGGEIAAVAASLEALVQAAERCPLVRGGLARPNPQFIYAGMSLQRRLIVDLMRAIRELAGGAFLAVPSSEASFRSPETGPDTRRYFQSVTANAEDRVKLLKLMWDFVGTEFAGRQLQYEMFYSASQVVVNSRLYRAYDWAHGERMVDRCLSEY